MRLTYIGGPTALLEIDGLRLLTDPTFDPAGSEYPAATYVLRKTEDPAVTIGAIGEIDAVLLSHDHHSDNLDRAGRVVLSAARSVITTTAGAARLGGTAIGLEPWHHHDVQTSGGRVLRVTATPARHGPRGGDRGPVVGFVLAFCDGSGPVVYISGDSVWYEGIAEVANRVMVDIAVLFAGAARVREVGPAHLTFTAAEAVTVARVFERALIVPLHFEGWTHFSETRDDLRRAFVDAHLDHRLRLPMRGDVLDLSDF